MKITDKVYGTFEVTEPVILELLASPGLARLKKVSQYGIPDRYHHKKNFSRYDHSLGVMLLLRKLGASIEEQIAGLTHDLSHSSFSHVSDWIFGSGRLGNEDYQDSIQNTFLQSSDIPKILDKYQIDPKDINHNKEHVLLELDIPDVCADRIDYTLRELATDGTDVDIDKVVNSMKATGAGIVFDSTREAKIFSEQYLYLQKTNWGSELSKVRYTLLADAMKKAIDIGIIKKEDFWTKDEDYLITTISSSSEPLIQYCLKELESDNPRLDEVRKSLKKVRYVDPLVIVGGGYIRLSEVDKGFASDLEKSKRESGREFVLPHH